MFDKLDDILMRLEEVLNQLSEPDVAADAAKLQKLMKEQAELQPIADAYKDYKTQKQTIEESLMLLEEESDEEMREMLKEELSDAKKRVEELEQELKVLLLPKDPNDDKNVIVEFRRCRRRRGGTLYRRNLPYVHQIRREPRLENRADQRR